MKLGVLILSLLIVGLNHEGAFAKSKKKNKSSVSASAAGKSKKGKSCQKHKRGEETENDEPESTPRPNVPSTPRVPATPTVPTTPSVPATPSVPSTPAQVGALPAGLTWYWQLTGAVNTSRNAQVYDVDMSENSAALFASLKAQGKAVICYFSAGSYENFRTDAAQFPKATIGLQIDNWPGEYWADVRDATVRSIMTKRLDEAKAKGCDGVEPDNLDAYANKSGLNITQADEVAYLKFLAGAAHDRGLTIALKNSPDLVPALVNDYDFGVVEECFKYNECEAYSPFIAKNKAVLSAEYSGYSASICTKAKQLGFSTVFYNLDLDGKTFQPCP